MNIYRKVIDQSLKWTKNVLEKQKNRYLLTKKSHKFAREDQKKFDTRTSNL